MQFSRYRPPKAAKLQNVKIMGFAGTPLTVSGMHVEAPKASKSMLKGSVYLCTKFQPNPTVQQGAIKFPPNFSKIAKNAIFGDFTQV